jgi:hypothetical protein
MQDISGTKSSAPAEVELALLKGKTNQNPEARM